MRSLCLLAVFVCAQVSRGEEQAAAEKQQPKQPAQVETSRPEEAGKQVVLKPVIADDQNGVKQAAAEQQQAPLHEHPTLLKMLFRNNELRRTRGLWSHRINPALTKAAQDHAVYMARTRDFNHYSNLGPTGRAVKYGFRGGVLENIAWGYGDVESAFTTWQHSGGHWANMTSSTTDAGFGFARSADGTPYWVAVYGTAPAQETTEVRQASATEPAGEAGAVASESSQTQARSAASYGSASRGRWLRRR